MQYLVITEQRLQRQKETFGKLTNRLSCIILKINGHDVKTIPQLTEQLGQFTPGNTIQLTFSRDGKVNMVDVVLHDSYRVLRLR